MRGPAKGRELAIVVGILLGAAAFRYLGLDMAPPGMTGDEGMNGMTIIQLLTGTHPRGRFPIFFFDNVPKEPIFIYLQTGSVWLFGQNVFALRFVSASVGLLTICCVYALAKWMFNRRVALLTLGLVGFSFWHIHFSRVGLRSILPPLFVSIGFYFFWRGLDGQSAAGTNLPTRADLKNWVIGGLWLGLGFYTYPSSRFAPVVLATFIVYLLVRYVLLQSKKLPGAKFTGAVQSVGGIGLIVLVSVSLLVAAPLFAHWLAVPSDFTSRADSVLIFNPITGQGSLSQLLPNMINGLGMFSFTGEPASRWGMAGRPIFDPVTSIFFYAGLLYCLRYLVDPKKAFALIWVTIMILPDILTRDSPQFSRAMGALPVVFMFPALSMDLFLGKLGSAYGLAVSTTRKFVNRRNLLYAVPALWIVATAAMSYRDYFRIWNTLELARANFNGDLYTMDQYINSSSEITKAYIAGTAPEDWDRANSGFLVQEPKVAKHFDARQSLVFPAASTQEYAPMLFGLSSPPDEIRARFLPESDLVYTGRYYDGMPSFQAYRARSAPQTAADYEDRAIAAFGDLVQLTGYETGGSTISPGKLRVVLKWRVQGKADRDDYSFFVHLLDNKGQSVAEQNGNGYAPADWEKGEEFLTWYDLVLPEQAETQVCWLDVGMYTWRDRKPTPATDAKGNVVGTSIRLADVKITGSGSVVPRTEPRHLVDVNFGNRIRLVGYTRQPFPSEGDNESQTINKEIVSLYWKSLRKTDINYTAFLHALNSEGKLIFQKDSQPQSGRYPTSFWDEGELVVDEVVLVDSDEARSLVVGLYAPSGERLPVLNADGVIVDDKVEIGN